MRVTARNLAEAANCRLDANRRLVPFRPFQGGIPGIRIWSPYWATLAAGIGVRSPGVAFRPDGKEVASAGLDCKVRLWDPNTLHELALLDHQQKVRSVAYSPDGKMLAAGLEDADGAVQLWDVTVSPPVPKGQPFPKGPCKGTRVAFSSDGRLAIGGGARDRSGFLILWDVMAGQQLAELHGYTHQVLGVAFSPDGKRLASANWGGTVRLWDVSGPMPTETDRRKNEGRAHSVAWSPDGKRLAAGVGGAYFLWDVTGPKLTKEGFWKTHLYAGQVVFTPDGKMLVVGNYYGRIRLVTLEELERLPGSNLDDSRAFSSEGRLFAFARPSYHVTGYLSGRPNVGLRQRVRRDGTWRGDSLSPKPKLPQFVYHNSLLAFAPGGETLATWKGGSKDWGRSVVVRLWPVRRGDTSIPQAKLDKKVMLVSSPWPSIQWAKCWLSAAKIRT